MTEPSHIVKMAMLQAMAANLDQGEEHATMVYYDGVRPTSVEVAVDPSARLVTLTLPNPCVKQVNENSIELYPSNAAIAIKTATAIWARLYNAAGQAVIDLDMGVEIQLDSYEIVLGSTQQLDAIFIEPE
ncbi:hypothetical protein [Acinetobacter schindleri]|uniref:Uncharacterized protein n=1 Tax=Acinetobacter schindleri TaxID=108981 RepID=A0AAE6WUY5_9GAMM|nr:hypothetical protein [Acinetobacter schindleri]QIC67485.1 hypothetical protein FSC10_08880 [Acinetobacter schindleri]